MKIMPIINKSLNCVAKNMNLNKSLFVTPMLVAISAPETLANDTFTKATDEKVIVIEKDNENNNMTEFADFNMFVEKDDSPNKMNSERNLRKISRLNAKIFKYEEKLKEKEESYNLYNTLLKAINGDKDSKKKVLKHVQENSIKRDIAIFAGTGVAGVVLSMVTGPAALLISMTSFFTSNQIDNYVVEKKTNPKQKQEVINEIKKLETEIKDINEKINEIQFKISEFK